MIPTLLSGELYLSLNHFDAFPIATSSTPWTTFVVQETAITILESLTGPLTHVQIISLGLSPRRLMLIQSVHWFNTAVPVRYKHTCRFSPRWLGLHYC